MKTRVCVQVDVRVHAVRDHCFWGFLQIKRRKNAPTLSPTPATPLSAASENNGVLTAHKPSDVSGFSALMFLDEADETCRTSESSLEASGASINTPTHTNTSIIRFQGFCRDDENQTDSRSAPRSTNRCWLCFSASRQAVIAHTEAPAQHLHHQSFPQEPGRLTAVNPRFQSKTNTPPDELQGLQLTVSWFPDMICCFINIDH